MNTLLDFIFFFGFLSIIITPILILGTLFETNKKINKFIDKYIDEK